MKKHAFYRRAVIAPAALPVFSRPLPAQGLKWAVLASIAQVEADRAIKRNASARDYMALTRIRGICLSVGRDPVPFRAVLDELRALATKP